MLISMKEASEFNDKYLELADKAIKLFNDSKIEGKTAEAVEQVKNTWQAFFRE